MTGNIFRTTFKYLKRQPFFTAINLSGMVIALTAVFFAVLYSSFELNYDHFNKNADSIYRLVTDVKTETGTDYQSAPAPLANAIAAEYPQVKSATRFLLDYLIIQKDDALFAQENIAYADSSIFNVFTLPLIEGNSATVLNTPMTLVLSETAAKKYFGDANPVGRQLKIDGKPATVTGVMKDIPFNSHFRTDVLVSISTLLKEWNPSIAGSWTFNGFYTYLLINNPQQADQLEKDLPSFVNRHYDQTRATYSLKLEPLKTVYLHGAARGSRTGTTATGNFREIVMTCIVAAFILLIAIINFVNLTTAYSLKRAREVGVRKVLGASRRNLILQFIVDALVLSQIAFLFSVILSAMLLPAFTMIVGKTVTTGILAEPVLLFTLWMTSVLTGIVAGFYPALLLSSFQPSKTLKGQLISGLQGASLRRALVVTQFAVSIILIIATFVIYAQLFFMRNNDPGFKKDHLLVVDYFFDQRVNDPLGTFKNRLLSIPGVNKVSYANCIPGKPNRKRATLLENRSGEMQSSQTDFFSIDNDYLDQYGLELVAGRGFNPSLASDSTQSMIINEAAVKSLGYSRPEDAIGKKFSQMIRKGTIIGVIKDFHFHSFQEEIRPLTVRMEPQFYTFLTLTIRQDAVTKVIPALEKLWSEQVSGMPLNYSFSDEAFHQLFIAEERTGKLFSLLALMAIVISSLGLLGLSAFSTQQRQKEVGIRKMLGASSLHIARILSADQVKPVGIAFLIASPLAWYSMHLWLQQYSYRVGIDWYIFPLAGLFALLIALATISVLTIRTARNNPVEALK